MPHWKPSKQVDLCRRRGFLHFQNIYKVLITSEFVYDETLHKKTGQERIGRIVCRLNRNLYCLLLNETLLFVAIAAIIATKRIFLSELK